MSLTYRMVREDDLPELKRLWIDETGWGTITEQMWQRYVVDAPLGGVSGAVAVDDATGAIVGQFAFMPSLVAVEGREYRAFRPIAPIVAKSCRFRSLNPLDHPAAAMYRFAASELRGRGDGLIYMVPDPRWVRFFKMFPNLQAGKYPLWKVDVPRPEALPMPEGYAAAPVSPSEHAERVDALWANWSRVHPCAVVRDSRSLGWKLGGGEYEVLGVERGGELAGLVASRQKGDRQWLICDLLAADTGPSLRATLAAVVNLASERALEADPARPIRKASVLATPAMEPALRDLGFVRDEYDFPMIVHILSPSLSKEDLAPSRWYVSAND